MRKFLKYLFAVLFLLALVFFSLGFFKPSVSWQNKVEVHSSIAHAFAVFINLNKMKDWMPGFRSIEIVSGIPFMKGSKYKIRMDEEGMEIEMLETLTELSPNEVFSFTLDNDRIHSEVSIHFTSKGDDATEISAVNKLEGKNMFWRSAIVFAEKNIVKKQEEMYNKLKKVIENTPHL